MDVPAVLGRLKSGALSPSEIFTPNLVPPVPGPFGKAFGAAFCA